LLDLRLFLICAMAFHGEPGLSDLLEHSIPSPVPLGDYGDYGDITGLDDGDWNGDDGSLHSVLCLPEEGQAGKLLDLGPRSIELDIGGDMVDVGGGDGAPNAFAPPPPPKEEPAARSSLADRSSPTSVDTLFTDDELRNSEPDEWALLRDGRIKGLHLSEAELQRIAKLRRRKRGCVHAATQRVRRAEKSKTMKDRLTRMEEQLTASRVENAGLRAELAELHGLIAIFNGGKSA